MALHNPEAMIYYGLYCTVAMCFIMLLINIALGSILGSLFWLLLTVRLAPRALAASVSLLQEET